MDERFYGKVGVQNIQALSVAIPVMCQKIPVFLFTSFPIVSRC
jgi:hypothetical protein